MPDTNNPADIGHNRPPADADAITERLTEEHERLLARRDELLDAVTRVPESVEDDDTAGRVADFYKQLHACEKNADAARKAEKEPYLEGGRRVDGFFKKITDPITKAKKDVEARLTAFQRKKAEAERRRREEEERKAREEAERARRELDEKIAALQETDYEQWDADALLKVHQDKIGTPACAPDDRDSLIAALRQHDETALQSAIDAEEAAKKSAEAVAKAEREADASAADLSRNRGEHGSVASLRTVTTFRNLDRKTLDLEALREHLPIDALEKAVRAFIKAGGTELRGVEIYEDYTTTVR